MAEDNGKEEEKFDFTPEGEGYISLAEARVLAMQTASSVPGDYGRSFQGVAMVFEVVESGEDDDYYNITLSFRPQGNFDGTPGQEQFVIGKESTIALRQVLSSPIRKGGGFPVIPVAIGVVVVGVIAAVGAVVALSSSGGESVPVAVVAPTERPAPIESTVNIEKTIEAGVQRGLAEVTPVPVAPAAKAMPTPKPAPAAKAVPTPKPTPAAKAVPTPKPTAAKAPATAAKPSGTLTVGHKELGTFQGHPALAVNPALFVQQTAPISEGLITINVDKQVQGSLAKSWDISPDFKTWTFYLQEGVQFHKGYGEMTAEDVIWSYRDGWAGNPRHARTPDFIAFWRPRGGKVTAVDKYTVEVNTGIALPELVVLENWLAKTPSGSSNWVTSKKQSDEMGMEAANRDIAGTGPWEMIEHRENEFWRMNAVEDHWRQTPSFAELIFREIPEESSRIAGFQTGQLDTFLMAFDSIPRIEKVEGAKLLAVSNAIDYAINLYGGYYTEASKPDTENRASYDPEVPWISSDWHTDSPEWENARKIRVALAISVDRDTIIETLLRGFADPIKLWFWGNHGSQIDGDWEYNPERAKQLLSEAGYPDGFDITLTPSLRGAPAEVEACGAIAQMWGDIGLNVKLQSLPYSTLRPTMVARTYQGATCHAAGARIVTVGAQTLITENAAWNAGASHPWLEDIMPRISAAVDPVDLVRLESELGNWLFDNALTYIGLYSVGAVWPVGPRIEEWKADIKFTDLRNINGYEYITPR